MRNQLTCNSNCPNFSKKRILDRIAGKLGFGDAWSAGSFNCRFFERFRQGHRELELAPTEEGNLSTTNRKYGELNDPGLECKSY